MKNSTFALSCIAIVMALVAMVHFSYRFSLEIDLVNDDISLLVVKNLKHHKENYLAEHPEKIDDIDMASVLSMGKLDPDYIKDFSYGTDLGDDYSLLISDGVFSFKDLLEIESSIKSRAEDTRSKLGL